MSLYIDLFKTVASDVCVNSFVLQATDCRNQKWAHESISQESFSTDLWEQKYRAGTSHSAQRVKRDTKGTREEFSGAVGLLVSEDRLFYRLWFFFLNKVTFQNFLSATVTILGELGFCFW